MYTLVSPWPPQRNGIADYAFEIARWTDGPLQVVTEAPRPSAPPGPHVRLMDERSFLEQPPERRLPVVYHVGNNPDHAFLVPLFLRRPGIVVLHDLSLHYLAEQVDTHVPGFLAHQLRAERPGLADALQRVWTDKSLKRIVDHQEVPLLQWLAPAHAIIVHSHHAARIVQARLPGVAVHVVPHFAYLSGTAFEALVAARRDLRARWAGIPAAHTGRALIVIAAGFPRHHKQYAAVLRAIATLPGALREHVLFLVAGEVEPDQYDLDADIARFGVADRVRLLGYLETTALTEAMLASDLVLNMRYPSFGESSGILARALGLGCAAVVTETGAYAELPDAVCFKIPARADPGEALRALFRGLLADPAAIVSRRRAAYAYARSIAPVQAARRYAELARG